MLDTIRQAFGDDLTSYLLGGVDFADDSGTLSPNRTDAVATLLDLANEINGSQEFIQKHLLREQIFEFQDSYGTTIARHLHLTCGGDEQVFSSSDPVEAPLLTVARDLYGASFLPAETTEWFSISTPHIGRTVFKYPATAGIEHAILDDQDLKNLFPDANPDDIEMGPDAPGGVMSSVVYSNGDGGSLHLYGIPQAILDVSFILLSGKDDSSCKALLSAVSDNLAVARRLAKKERTGIPTLVGIGNVTLDADLKSVKLDERSRMRRVHPRDVLITQSQNVGEVMLETTTDVKILSIEKLNSLRTPEESDADLARFISYQTQHEAAAKVQQRAIDMCRFSLLLASEEDNIIAPTQTFLTTLNPLSSGRSWNHSLYRYPISPLPPQKIDQETADRAGRWAQALKKQPANLDMGMRRLLSAATLRIDPMDGFVDAVIAWENMFGTPEGESSFRISGAIATLIEPTDPVKRKQLFTEARDLYGIRSKLVHGAKEPDARTAMSHRDRAIRIGIDSFRQIYESDALLQADSSSVRSRVALLDF